MKAPLEKVADNLPPPTRPAPLTSADERRSGYAGLNTGWTSWEQLQVLAHMPWGFRRAITCMTYYWGPVRASHVFLAGPACSAEEKHSSKHPWRTCSVRCLSLRFWWLLISGRD